MNKQEYWQAHVKKNPRLADENATVTLKVEMLHRLLDDAFDKGANQTSIIGDKFRDIVDKIGGLVEKGQVPK